jgi:hypothetical protein
LEEEIKAKALAEEEKEAKKEHFNHYNKYWIKRGEFIYFYQVINDKNS